MSTIATARLLVGRKIVAVDLQPFDDDRGGIAHNPRITLDNGAVIFFVAEETDVGDYGIWPGYQPIKPRGGR